MKLNNPYFYLLIVFATIVTNSQAQKHALLYPNSQHRKLSSGKTKYYIDPKMGDDNNNGTNKLKPWKTFIPANNLIFNCGDVLEILSAGAFHETLMLKALGKQSSPVVIKFAEGRYDIFPDHALGQKLHITNTNDTPNAPKSIALMFDSCQYIKVTGTNAKFFMRGKMIETYMNHCTNIILEGLSFDYHRPTVSETTAINITPTYADLRVNPDSKYTIRDSMIIWHGEGWSHQPDYYWQVTDLQKDELSRIEFKMKELRFADIGNQLIRIYFKKNPGFKKDLIYQNRDIIRDCAGFFMNRSKNITLKNIRIYYMHGMGIVGQYCENIKIDHFVVKPDESSGKTCAAWADILHFAGCKGKIEIGNSYLSAANDDAINVHGIHLMIKEIAQPKQILVEFMHNQTFGFNPYAVGDSIDFIRPATLLPIGSNAIVKTTMINAKQVLLELKDPIASNVSLNDVIENTTATPTLWIHDNTIARIPTRGILTTTRRKTIIERNRIAHTRMSGILVNDDAAYWFESGIVKDLTIRNNNFVRCAEPVIDIHPENKIADKVAVHSNISILNNNFELEGNLLFSAKSTSNIQIKGNKIKMPKPIKKIEDLVDLRECKSIQLSNNTILSK